MDSHQNKVQYRRLYILWEVYQRLVAKEVAKEIFEKIRKQIHISLLKLKSKK